VILISGATGRIGRPLVHALSTAGAAVRAMTRDPASVVGVIGPGVEIVEADLGAPATLDAALQGIEKAFLLPPASMRQVRLESNFVDAARRAGVRQLVKLSMLSADPKSPGPLLQWHGMAEKRVEGSGMEFTHLRPNFFMQNMLWFARSIREIDTFCLPMDDARVAIVDARDVAEAAAAVLLGSGHEGRTYRLTGPEALSFEEVASLLSRAVGRTIAYKPISPEQFQASIVKNWQLSAPYARAIVSVWRGMRAGLYAESVPDLAEVLGRKPRRFAEFADEHAMIFVPRAPGARAASRRTA